MLTFFTSNPDEGLRSRGERNGSLQASKRNSITQPARHHPEGFEYIVRPRRQTAIVLADDNTVLHGVLQNLRFRSMALERSNHKTRPDLKSRRKLGTMPGRRLILDFPSTSETSPCGWGDNSSTPGESPRVRSRKGLPGFWEILSSFVHYAVSVQGWGAGCSRLQLVQESRRAKDGFPSFRLDRRWICW